MSEVEEILQKESFSRQDILRLLATTPDERQLLYQKAQQVKQEHIGNKVYYRGLIEFSNICKKDCYYCGIRASNTHTERYDLDVDVILAAVLYAHENRYASVVLQSGERTSRNFVDKIDDILKESKRLTNGEIGITLSLGEQTEEVYQRWFDSGAHRYLLRIESSTPGLYYKIHPENKVHDFETRLNALRTLKKIGYQTGTGVMVGLPFQTNEHLADDLLFFQSLDIDMVGMGPYVEHTETPLYQHKNSLMPQIERFNLTLKMIAILRIIMKDINIAAATALQAIDPLGREKALKVGANIMMPNITPTSNRKNYQLYENKPCIDEGADECTNCLEGRIAMTGDVVAYGEWGDSLHFKNRIDKHQ